MNGTTTKKLYPTTKLDLRKPDNWQPNETSRTPMTMICSDGGNNWPAAFAYVLATSSRNPNEPTQSLSIDSMIAKNAEDEEYLVWYLRTFRDTEENSVMLANDEMNEDIYEEERGM